MPANVFPFLKLPAELRVHVYRMALQRDEPLLLHLERWDHEEAKDDRTLVYRTQLPWPRAPPSDINVALLRTCSLIYKEARQVLYGDNTFTLRLHTGISTLSLLHQRSRSLIKSVQLTIPTHHDILDGFADLVRLGLRYCWGLKKFTIMLDGLILDDRVYITGATSVYSTAFHILRFLPKGCKVLIEGDVSEQVKNIIMEEGRLLEELDEVSLPSLFFICAV